MCGGRLASTFSVGESSRAKNSALAEEGEEQEKTTAERNRNVGVIFTPRLPLMHPRRDFLPVKSLFAFFIYWSIFICAGTLPGLQLFVQLHQEFFGQASYDSGLQSK